MVLEERSCDRRSETLPKGNEANPREIADIHQEAFCRSFVREGRRERLLAKPDELSSRFHHDLPRMFTRGRFVLLAPPVIGAYLLHLVRSLTSQTYAVYLGNGMEEGRYTLGDVIDEIACSHSAVASIEPGELALYATEGCPRPDWYLLCTDPRRLVKASELWQNRKSGSR